jgi:glycosyltransferase involved in cell wall biosynthesis
MKVIHINFSDTLGGAARATYRIHRALLYLKISSLMWVRKKISSDKTVIEKKNFKFINNNIRKFFVKILIILLKTKNPILHSPQIFSSDLVDKINNSDADIIHLHWFQFEMLSIADIPKITKPIVWTLHDMWGFCGAEHISYDSRWLNGYKKKNRPEHEGGFDLNNWTWRRKKKYWVKPIQIVTPTKWLGSCAQRSKLMKNWPIKIIPVPIDTNFWKSINKNHARRLLNLPKNIPLFLFGTWGNVYEYNKGIDLLYKAVNKLNKNKKLNNFQVLIIGDNKNKVIDDLPNSNFYGQISNIKKMRLFYSAVDILLIPSRIENFGQMALESQSCGTPVVSFDSSGLTDIIKHKKSGYLANSFDSSDFAKGIEWTYNNKNKLSIYCTKIVKKKFNFKIVAEMYKKIYKKIL